MTVPTPAYLDYEEMREKADAFLVEHGREGRCPVDIEAIVDVALGIDIVPVSGLKSDHDIDGLSLPRFGGRLTAWESSSRSSGCGNLWEARSAFQAAVGIA